MPRPQGRWDGALYSRLDVQAILKGLLGHDGPVTGLTLARFLREAELPSKSKAVWRATVVLEDAGLLAPDVKWDWEIFRPLQGSKENDGEDGTLAFYARAIREAEGTERAEVLRARRRAIIEGWQRRHPVSPWYPPPRVRRQSGAQDPQGLPGAVPGRKSPRLWRSRGLTVGGRGVRRTRKDVGPNGAVRRSPAWLPAPAKAWGRQVLWWRGLVQVVVAVLPPDLPSGWRDHPASKVDWGRAYVDRLAAFDEILRDLREILGGVDSVEAVGEAVRAWLDEAPENLPLRAAYRAWPPVPEGPAVVEVPPPWVVLPG